ncbi:MAG: Two-component sensor kinase SA14-24 [Candidatus Carbobacillus altaicus]|uniref:histidine kinase n=1 Tax=Candidatus Carbonibacillus altaicus TaxID=2163959 RepID=A0A2R6Y460_9BACL|nr:MAG: Two-component sensor kinase SA14-24 [Candidatus Carbobacillus altaicus]
MAFFQKGIRLTVERAENEAYDVCGDMDLLERVLDNIVSNALKYTPPGGVVTMSVERRGDNVRVSVQDSGIGIPPDEQKKVFERFYRVDKARSRAHGGSGLGLSIAREIMIRLNGSIGLTSDGETGTTVWFELPAKKEDEAC